MSEINIYNTLMKEINNIYGVCGLMGNLKAESNLISNNAQNSCMTKMNMTDESYTKAVDNGTYTSFSSDRVGYGLAQWTSSNRKAGLYDYAKYTNRSIGDENMQLEWLIRELKASYKTVYNTLKNATSLKEASDIVVLKYEIPASVLPSASVAQRNTTLAKRESLSLEFYNKYNNNKNNSKEEQKMSNSSLVNYTLISPNKNVMNNKKNKKITIHHMAGNLTVETCGKGFSNPARQASSNYGIGTDGRVGLYVEEKDRAWTSSSATNDKQAVTIEVANSENGGQWKVSDKAYNKLIELCVDICKRNGIPKLVWTGTSSGTLTCHYMFATTACPGPYLKSKMALIADEVNNRLGVKTNYSGNFNATTGTTNNTSKVATYTVQSGDTLGKIGTKVGVPWKTIADINNIKAPYIIKKGQVLKLTATATTTTTTSTSTSSTAKKYVKNGVDYSLVFDPNYYASKYDDLKKAYGTDATKLFNHFYTYGMHEARQAIATFNVTVYKNSYADLRKAFNNDLPAYYKHYIQFGKNENRTKCK